MHARKNKGKGFLDAPCGRIEKTLPKGSPIEEESVVHAAAPSPPTSELRFRVFRQGEMPRTVKRPTSIRPVFDLQWAWLGVASSRLAAVFS